MDFITDAQCQQIVEVHKKSKYEKIKHFNVSKTFEIPQTPNGHLGEYFTLEITLQNGEVLRYFVKKILTTPNRPDFINLVMRKEINFYKWLNSTETTTAAVEISFCVPKYYLSTDNFIVMELLDPFQPLTREDFKHEYFKSAVAALAKLHALVIFVERQTPPEEEMVTEAMLTKTVYIEAINKGVMKYLAHSNYDQDLPWKFKEKVQKMIELFTEDKQNQFKIVCHGDLWINNLLFNKNQCKIIDYQLIRRAEPAHDLCTLLIHNLGFNHFAEFCNLYYDELVTECLKFNVDIIREFSRIDFEASIKRHATSALITKIIYAAFSSANKLRKAQRLNIALDHLMAQNDYDFLLAITTMDQEEKFIFDGLFHDFVQFESNQWVTADVVHRFVHQCFPGAVLCDFKFKDGVLCVKLTFDGVFKEVKFTVRQPNVLYEFFPIAACGDLQKCYFYLKNDLMIMECLEDTHKRLNLREPFGLTDVKVILKALANFHALSYLHQNKSENVPRKNIDPTALESLFKLLGRKVNWKLVSHKLNVPKHFGCVQHACFNHEFIYFPNEKFDTEQSIFNETPCKIILGDEVVCGSACEEVLSFLFSSTLSSFWRFYTEDMLIYYYECLSLVLQNNQLQMPFELHTFLHSRFVFNGRAVVNALLYHQRVLIEEKQRVFNQGKSAVISEYELKQNYLLDPVFKERIDATVDEFCNVFHDCVT